MSAELHDQLPAVRPTGRDTLLITGDDPDPDAFGAALAPDKPRHRQLRKLLSLLVELEPRGDDDAVERGLLRLTAWVRRGGEPPAFAGGSASQSAAERRLRLLVAAVEAFPSLRVRLAHLVQRVLVHKAAVNFLARVGIPGDRGLFAETADRVSRRLMPQPADEEDVTDLVARLFPTRADVVWLSLLSPDVVHRLVKNLRSPHDHAASFAPPPPSVDGQGRRVPMPSVADLRQSIPEHLEAASTFAPLRSALLDGILLLASRVSAAGLSDAIRARSPACALRDSPFFRLPRMIDGLLGAPRHDVREAAAWADECRTLVEECRRTRQAVVQRLESQGVSVDVVYRLELIDRSLDRLELLVALLVPQSSEELAHKASQILARLLSERRRERSLSDIVRTNTRLLARKIIERAGQTGEHYITVSPREWILMILSAGGGGLLTGATAAGKFMVGGLQRPLFQELFLNAANYSGSFLLMQLLGFTLATKQPSMTAAALAGALQASEDFAPMVTTIARITRSQLAAAVGNLSMVIPASLAIDQASLYFQGTPFLDETTARYVIGSLHPTQSGTIPYAALTGVLLWMSSLAAGWLENWAVYRRIPEAIAEHRARRFIGTRLLGWMSRVFSRNIAGVGGNTTLGTMLAATPILGKFLGVPLDVRHVTLSTGALTLAVCALGTESVSTPEVQAAAVGIAIVGALNFGVSFVLALGVALRAREVRMRRVLRLVWELTKSFVRSPLRFFLPVGEKGVAPSTHH